MPLLLRKINKARWNREGKPDWLPNGQIPAQILCDLNAKDNNLSVWLVEEDHSNLDNVIVALCSACDQPDKMDYALFDEEDCRALGIVIEKSGGKTPDMHSNKWHRNLVRLSASKVSELADLMYKKASRDRIKETRVKEMIKGAWSIEGRIDKDKLRKKMKVFLDLEKVQKCPECGQEVE